MNRIPVFFVDGFLDSGKTSFIIDTIKGDYDEYEIKTLLLVCEQGEIEYDESFLKSTKTTAIYFENQNDFDYKKIGELVKLYNPDRVVVEMNGMWDLAKIQFPKILAIAQFISFFDGQTFPTYFNNMRQMISDMIKHSQIVCFTKLESFDSLEQYQTPLKLVGGKCKFFTMNEKGEAQPAFEDELPYDINEDVIKIKEEDFGRFYIDTFEHRERYINKTIELDIMVIKAEVLKGDTFVAGRFIMNCCANDIQLFGFLCKNSLGKHLKHKQSIKLKAKILVEFSEEYQEEELVLDPIEINILNNELDEVLNLTV